MRVLSKVGFRRALVAAVVLGMVAVVPGTTQASTSRATSPSATKVLRVGANLQQAQTNALDPRMSVTAFDILYMSAMFSPLMKFDRAKNKYTPFMAKTVTVTDPQNFRVTLRSDAKFDTGAPVTSADAKASLETTVANLKAGRCNGCNAGDALITGVDVVDPQTFIIKTSAPALGVIYEILSGRDTFISPATAGAEQNVKPVGTGPYKFVSFSPGQSMIFTKSTTFFDAKNVKFSGMQILHLLAGSPQTNALLAGDIDVAHEIGVENVQAVRNKGLGIFNIPDPNSAFDYVDLCKLPGSMLDDVRVRQALSYGTDRIALGKAVSLTPTWTEWAPGTPYYDKSLEKKYAYNPTKAKELLTAAGVIGKTFNIVMVTNVLAQWPEVGLVLKSQWEKLGITVNLVQSTDQFGDWLNIVRRNVIPTKGPMSINALSRPGLQKLTRLLVPGGPANACTYNNPALTQIATDLASLNPTDAQAIAKWKQSQAIVAEDLPVIPLLIDPVVVGWAKNISGVSPNTIVVPIYADWAALSPKKSA